MAPLKVLPVGPLLSLKPNLSRRPPRPYPSQVMLLHDDLGRANVVVCASRKTLLSSFIMYVCVCCIHNYNCIHLAKYVYIHMYAACTEKSAFVTPHAWRPKSAKHNRCMAKETPHGAHLRQNRSQWGREAKGGVICETTSLGGPGEYLPLYVTICSKPSLLPVRL